MSESRRYRIALTLGDPAGIGPEIVLKALCSSELPEHLSLVVLGEHQVVVRQAQAMSLDVAIYDGVLALPEGRRIDWIEVPSLGDKDWQLGQVGAASGQACYDYAKAAIALVQAGKADAVIAAPHTEASVNQAGIHFRGYPQMVAEQTETPLDETFLMLLSPDFRIVNLTLHEPLADAVARIREPLIVNALMATLAALKRLGLEQGRIGVCGLNPHAGEGGLMGQEDEAIIRPAVAQAVAQGVLAEGPFPADALFADRQFDAYLAMYHDQGHIPFKVTAPRKGSAITIGTPVVFGSVAHGSALDIAGRNKASAAALIQALKNISHVS
ncbi:MAG: 4-hydroxythreonine-4-phosphate dehydrogenase PdxA [Saccharospirillum sp.]|nr:4-hydroxythreonine-4-phosphate dehydrogenase PdxA [Saccharospirillum sp.]